MVHICVFSGHEGDLRAESKFYLTLFAGRTLRRPTLARQLLAYRRAREMGSSQRPRPFFLTIFGGVEFKAPTLAEEFLDLAEAFRSGALSTQMLDQSLADLDQSETVVMPVTLFGGFDECKLPAENDEIESLAVQCHLGNISDAAGQVLRFGIGKRNAERRVSVRKALTV